MRCRHPRVVGFGGMIGTPQSGRSRRSLACLLIVALAGCTETRPVGLGVALSGSFVDAARLAIADAVAEGGVPLLDTILVAEVGSRAAPALEIADRFRTVTGMVAVVAHSNSASSLATAPIYNEAAIVQLAPTSTAASYSRAGPYSFRLVPPDPTQGAVLARALDSLHPAGARVAVLYVNDDYGRGIREAFLAELDPARFVVAHDQPHADEELDLPPVERDAHISAIVERVLDDRPEVIVWLGRANTFVPYLHQFRQRAAPVAFLAGDGLSTWRRYAGASAEWVGVRYVDFLDESDPDLQEFRRRYRERFGKDAGTGEILSYDATRLLLAAVRDGARTGDEVRAWLHGLGRERPPYPGVGGPIGFDDHGDVTRRLVLLTIPGTTP